MSTVKVTGFDAGYLTVEWNGKTFVVFLACVTAATLGPVQQGLLTVEFLDSSQFLIGPFHVIAFVDSSTPAQSWTFLAGSVTAPPNTAFIGVIAQLFSDTAGTSVYFDDFTLIQVPEPSGLGIAGLLAFGFLRWRAMRLRTSSCAA